MPNLKYIAFFNLEEKCKERSFYPAANTKVAYIIQALNNIGYSIEVYSPALAMGASRPKELVKFRENTLYLLKSRFFKNILLNKFAHGILKFKFFVELLFSIKQHDTVLVYHSLYYINWIRLIKRLKHINLITEVEEIYGDVTGSGIISKKELSYFKISDGYIFPTQLLDEKINVERKKSIIIYGTYAVSPIICGKFDDHRIHCVYAGTFDPRKGGAAAAVAVAEFLDNRYHVHILGFGSDDEKERLLKQIREVSKKTECKVTFDGCLSGDEYLSFIQKCDIGLSTQNPEAIFNASSFPSKILSYMANGLRVVTVRIPVIESSSVGEFVYYYNEQTPTSIANAILSVNIKQPSKSRVIIEQLNLDFIQQLSKMLK
jgi:hypothetical protein